MVSKYTRQALKQCWFSSFANAPTHHHHRWITSAVCVAKRNIDSVVSRGDKVEAGTIKAITKVVGDGFPRDILPHITPGVGLRPHSPARQGCFRLPRNWRVHSTFRGWCCFSIMTWRRRMILMKLIVYMFEQLSGLQIYFYKREFFYFGKSK